MDPGPDRSERAFQGPRAQGPELTLTSSVIIMASWDMTVMSDSSEQ